MFVPADPPAGLFPAAATSRLRRLVWARSITPLATPPATPPCLSSRPHCLGRHEVPYKRQRTRSPYKYSASETQNGSASRDEAPRSPRKCSQHQPDLIFLPHRVCLVQDAHNKQPLHRVRQRHRVRHSTVGWLTRQPPAAVMGAGASTSPRSMDAGAQVGLFTLLQREYEQMELEQLADEVIFERMKQVRQSIDESTRQTVAPTDTISVSRCLQRSSVPGRTRRTTSRARVRRPRTACSSVARPIRTARSAKSSTPRVLYVTLLIHFPTPSS
jgi:hypothetical protein